MLNVGQEIWVVGSDKIKANLNAVELLEKKGYSKDTSFDLIKVFTIVSHNKYITYIA